MKKFLAYFTKYKWKAIFGSIMKLIEAIFELLNPLLVAKIVDVGIASLIIELTGNQNKSDAFLNLLADYEILELVRTGITGLARGTK